MKRLLVCAAAVLVLAGCGGPSNKDPRLGRVVTDHQHCLFGRVSYDNCDVYSYKVCVGPDLFVSVQGADDRTFRNSPECAS